MSTNKENTNRSLLLAMKWVGLLTFVTMGLHARILHAVPNQAIKNTTPVSFDSLSPEDALVAEEVIQKATKKNLFLQRYRMLVQQLELNTEQKAIIKKMDLQEIFAGSTKNKIVNAAVEGFKTRLLRRIAVHMADSIISFDHFGSKHWLPKSQNRSQWLLGMSSSHAIKIIDEVFFSYSWNQKGNVSKKWVHIIQKIKSRDATGFLKIQDSLLKAFAARVKATGEIPDKIRFQQIHQFSTSEMDSLFGDAISPGLFFEDYPSLKEKALELYPSKFKDAYDGLSFPENYGQKLAEAIRSADKVLVTTAVKGSPVDQKFHASIKSFIAFHKSLGKKSIVLSYVQNGLYNAGSDQEIGAQLFDQENFFILNRSIQLHPSMEILNISSPAKAANPLSSIAKVGNPRSSRIVMGTQQLVRGLPQFAPGDLLPPRFEFSTGAITNPNYRGKKYISKRTDFLAEQRHTKGFILLEKEAANGFSSSEILSPFAASKGYRPSAVTFDEIGGCFFHNDKEYCPDGVYKDDEVEALVIGDLHLITAHPKALAHLMNLITILKPKRLLFHDGLDGESINPHHGFLEKVFKAGKHRDSLYEEFAQLVSFLRNLTARYPEVIVELVHSNHPEWVKKWATKLMENGDFRNFPLGLEILNSILKGENWLEGLATGDLLAKVNENAPVLTAAERKNLIVGQVGQGHMVGGYLVVHGHGGLNGSRGISKSLFETIRNLIAGDSHKLEGDAGKGVAYVGMLHTDEGSYADGDGFTTHALGAAIVRKAREREGELMPSPIQLLTFQNNRWLIEDRDPSATAEQFFGPHYPKLAPIVTVDTDLCRAQIDSWSSFARACD